jgi:hypothetical protein
LPDDAVEHFRVDRDFELLSCPTNVYAFVPTIASTTGAIICLRLYPRVGRLSL